MRPATKLKQVDGRYKELGNRLQTRLGDYFPGLNAERCHLDLVRVRSAAYSQLVVFRGPESPNCESVKLAVKIFTGRPDLEKFARQQYEILLSLWPHFSCTESFKIPRPIDLWPDLPAIVMEEVQGRPVQEIVSAALWRVWNLKEAMIACQRCGEWLNYFHGATRITPGPLDAFEKSQSLQLNLAQLKDYGFAHELCANLQSKVHFLAGPLSTQYEERAVVHGDFSVDNVLLDGNRTTALDVDGQYRNLIYHDIASFLNSLALVSIGLPRRRSVIAKCADAFVLGYFERRNYNKMAVWFLRLSGLVSVALEVLKRRATQPLVNVWLRRRFVQLFNRLIAEAPI